MSDKSDKKKSESPKREYVYEKLEEFYPSDFDGESADYAISFFNGLKSKYPDKNLFFNLEDVMYSDYKVYVVQNKRLENDDEYSNRLKAEEKRKNLIEERERQEFLRLSQKFNNN